MPTQYTRQQLNEMAKNANYAKHAKKIRNDISSIAGMIYVYALDGHMQYKVYIRYPEPVIEGLRQTYPDIRYTTFKLATGHGDMLVTFDWSD
jgi:hypothetical protein